jgi:tRNA(fMet)-specific endonuclease VapC
MRTLIDSSVLIAAERGNLDLAAQLRPLGEEPGAHDAMIAATALAMGYQVATRNVRSFPKVPGLRVARW